MAGKNKRKNFEKVMNKLKKKKLSEKEAIEKSIEEASAQTLERAEIEEANYSAKLKAIDLLEKASREKGPIELRAYKRERKKFLRNQLEKKD